MRNTLNVITAIAALTAALGAAENSYQYGLLGEALSSAPSASQPFAPRYIGYGCEGTSGTVWAEDESAFPLCKEIVALEVDND